MMKNQKKYIPSPIDTSDVKLSDELNELGELLARNTHEVWALQRMRDGWSYGEERNDALKHHPGLVPYEELSEPEKLYDRNTSTEALKVIDKLGFDITRKH